MPRIREVWRGVVYRFPMPGKQVRLPLNEYHNDRILKIRVTIVEPENSRLVTGREVELEFNAENERQVKVAEDFRDLLVEWCAMARAFQAKYPSRTPEYFQQRKARERDALATLDESHKDFESGAGAD